VVFAVAVGRTTARGVFAWPACRPAETRAREIRIPSRTIAGSAWNPDLAGPRAARSAATRTRPVSRWPPRKARVREHLGAVLRYPSL